MFTPLSRAFAQLDDPVFLGVLVRALGWSAACFAVLLAGGAWELQALVAAPGWRWLGALAGVVGASLLAFWLFLPMAAVIATLYMDRVAAAVDRRFYPDMPPPRGASWQSQLWDGLALALRVLVLNTVALVLALALPGIGVFLGWAIAAWGLGRGLFVAVAMRRMSRAEALSAYGAQRMIVMGQGGILALASLVPALNLLIPVLGTAAMVHVLHKPFQNR